MKFAPEQTNFACAAFAMMSITLYANMKSAPTTEGEIIMSNSKFC